MYADGTIIIASNKDPITIPKLINSKTHRYDSMLVQP